MNYSFSKGALNGPAENAVIARLGNELNIALPNDYIDFLQAHNGGQGFVGDNYLILWKSEEVVSLNREYESSVYDPDIFLFGSNGGGDAYAFDISDTGFPIVCVPFIGMNRKFKTLIAKRFSDLFVPPATHADISLTATREEGLELSELTPVLLGGSPTDPKNKIWLTRRQHVEYVRYWNQTIAGLSKDAPNKS